MKLVILTVLLVFTSIQGYNQTLTANFTFNQSCLDFEFMDASTASGGAIITDWEWDFGDGFTSGLMNPMHSYTGNGTYNVSLKVMDNNLMVEDTYTANVNTLLPVAMFSFTSDCEVFQFSDESVSTFGSIVAWLWDFGDGAGTSVLQHPGYSYLSPGDFPVVLTVTDENGCQHSVSQTVSYFYPVAGFSFISDCETFQFTDESTSISGNIIEWLWDFGDGSGTSPDQNPVYTYSNPGYYQVSLTVTHENGCSESVTNEVNYFYPDAYFEFSLTGNCGEFQFINESQVASGILSYLWEFDDGTTSTDKNPLHVFADPGDHEVILTVTHESGCQSYYDDVVSFYRPVAQFSHDPACLGIETCFFDQSTAGEGNIVSWEWDFGNGSSSSLQNPCYIYGTPDEYIVTLVVVNSIGCSSEPVSDTLQVDYPPEADFIPSPACFNEITAFVNNSDTNNIAIEYWLWDFGDPGSGTNNTSGIFEPNHLFTAEGTFQVSLIVKNMNGCLSSILKPVVVDSIPVPSFILPDTVAAGTEFTITDNSVAHGTPILTRQWDFGDGTTSVNPNPVIHIYNQPGTYNVCLIVTNLKGCTDTLCQIIEVTSLPHADFNFTISPNLKVNFFDDSYTESIIENWFWDFGDLSVTTDTVSGNPNPFYTYPTDGFYEVYMKIIDSYNGIHDTLKTIYVGSAIHSEFSQEDVCSGDSVKFYDESYSLVSAQFLSWYWDFGDNTFSLYYERKDSIIHYYENPGVYDVTLITTGLLNGVVARDTILKQVSVYNPPVARIDSLHLVACLGQYIHFKDSSYTVDNDSITSWFWDFGDDEGTATTQNYSYKYDTIRDFIVTLTVNTSHFCQAKDSIIAKITIAPNIDFDIVNACLNSPAYFIPGESDIEITDYLWNFNDPYNSGIDTSSLESPSYVYTHIAVYNVTMEASSYGCTKTVDQSVLVYPIPYSDFTFTPNYTGVQGRTLFNNGSIYADSYLWDFGNGHTSNLDDPIEVYEYDSTYTITLISYNERCSDTSRYELMVFFRGLYFPTAFSPNNPNEEISLFSPKGINLAEYEVQVFDLKGNMLWESEELDENGSPAESWDGYYNGILMPEGMYIWKAKGTFRDGTIWKGSDFEGDNPKTNGTITLIR